MGNLLASLINSAASMGVFQRSLDVVQNNVTNASTPGYAKQRQSLVAMNFQPEVGLSGGVSAGDLINYRSEFAEQSVRTRNELYGRFAQKSSDLSQLEPLFDITQGSGISGALSSLSQSFSTLSVSPNDTSARQAVLDHASDVARNFNEVSAGLDSTSLTARKETTDYVAQINSLASALQEVNVERQQNAESIKDAGMDARLHSTLESLSEMVDFTTLDQPDGTVTVLLGGQTPLVMGAKQYPIQADFSQGTARILDSDGADITSQIQGGRLSSVVDLQNTLIPGYHSDLDKLAQSVADTYNSTLNAGVDANGNSPPPVALFTYDGTSGAASSLSVTGGIQPADIAAALPSAPGGNGNAVALAALATSKQLDGYSFTEFYGKVAGRVGRDLAGAQDGQQMQEQLLAQARTARNDVSGVSLDEEAAHLIEFQRSYQAAAHMITTLNALTDTVLNLLQ